MLLKELLGNTKKVFKNILNFDDMQVEGICRDSETVKDGDIYFCLSHNYEKAYTRCQEALKKGAKAAISDYLLPFERCVQVDDTRDTFANACANFYGRACDDLKIVGITGTNGKTTTSHVIAEMLKRNGKSVGVIGTNGVFYNGKTFPCPLTTPDADFLHKTFADMKKDGVEYVIMEVSAHAIDQKRINGIKFEIGVLTNITQDHLDYFKSFDNYEKTKLGFFNEAHVKKAIFCADDLNASKLRGCCKLPILSYGIYNICDAFAIDVLCTINGTRFVGNIQDSVVNIKTNLIGNYNVYNSLAALCVCKSFGLSDKELELGLNFINPVEGRFNVVKIDGKFVVIDFAHTPDGLANVLKAARYLTRKKVFVVFGCGGNRDRTKRWQMGAVAEQHASYVCLTDDNPRLEKSSDIIADIEVGLTKSHMVEPNRAKAIKKMIDLAMPGDVVIIAGKGAEKYQEIGTEKFEYNDFDVLNEYCKEKNLKKEEVKQRYDC